MNRKILFAAEKESTPTSSRLQKEFDVACARNSNDGLELLRDHGPFAIAISDLHLPRVDGVEFLKRVRQLALRTKRLLLADHLDFKDTVKAINEARIFRLLVQPVEESDLIDGITRALGSFRQREEERMRIELPVRVFRVQERKPLLAHTIDISQSGARIAGLEESLDPGELVRIECGDREAPLRVIWMGTTTPIPRVKPESSVWRRQTCGIGFAPIGRQFGDRGASVLIYRRDHRNNWPRWREFGETRLLDPASWKRCTYCVTSRTRSSNSGWGNKRTTSRSSLLAPGDAALVAVNLVVTPAIAKTSRAINSATRLD